MSLQKLFNRVLVDTNAVADTPAVPNIVNITRGYGAIHALMIQDRDVAAQNEYMRIRLDSMDTGTINLGDLGAMNWYGVLNMLNTDVLAVSADEARRSLPIPFNGRLLISAWRAGAQALGLRVIVFYNVATQ